MGFRLPDWLIYLTGLTLMVGTAVNWHSVDNAPPAPPPPGIGEMALFANFTPFSSSSLMNLPEDEPHIYTGTALSLSHQGEWIVSRDAVANCSHPFINIGGNLAVRLKIKAFSGISNYVMGTTEGGPVSLVAAPPEAIKPGMRGFMVGYPNEKAGEATAKLIGRTTLKGKKRFDKPETVLAWAQAGRTLELGSDLNHLRGGPVLDDNAQVVGITLEEKPRRGRIYTSTPETFAGMAKQSHYKPDHSAHFNMTRHNYGVMADQFRREYRVAQVGCILT